jgi:hypothetical protein
MSPAERLVRTDLEAGAFTAGVDRGLWRLHRFTWPEAIIELAVPPRANSDPWLALLFQVADYPEAPTARPWDISSDSPLAIPRWPGGCERITTAFNPGWRDDALYIPVDRQALEAHPEWRVKYACHTWDPGKDLTQYLRLVRRLLNDEGYTGARG